MIVKIKNVVMLILLSTAFIKAAPLNEEDALHALRSYGLATDEAAVKRLQGHRAERDMVLGEKSREAMYKEQTWWSWLTAQKENRFEQQKEVEERLWHLVSKMQFALERARAGRGLDTEIFSLEALLYDYYTNFNYQDTLLTGLAEEALFECKNWLIQFHEEQKNACTITRDYLHRTLSENGAPDEVKDDRHLEELDHYILAYSDNHCSTYDHHDVVADALVRRAAIAENIEKNKQELIKKKQQELLDQEIQAYYNDMRKDRLALGKSLLADTGVNMDEQRFVDCYEAHAQSFWHRLKNSVLYQWAFSTMIKDGEVEKEKLVQLVKQQFIAFYEDLRKRKIAAEKLSSENKETEYTTLIKSIRDYIETSYDAVSKYKGYRGILHDPAALCALHELEVNALSVMKQEMESRVESAQQCKEMHSKQAAQKFMGLIAPIAAMKEKLIYPIETVDHAYAVQQDCVQEKGKINPFQQDASALKGLVTASLRAVKLALEPKSVMTYKEVKDKLEKLKSNLKLLEERWSRFGLLNQWISKDTIQAYIKEVGNAEVNAVLEKFKNQPYKSKDHPVELFEQYKSTKRLLVELVDKYENELKYWRGAYQMSDKALSKDTLEQDLKKLEQELRNLRKQVDTGNVKTDEIHNVITKTQENILAMKKMIDETRQEMNNGLVASEQEALNTINKVLEELKEKGIISDPN